MSKALDYLLKTRPEAMGSYFDFLKQAGRGLDPRTRSIISVITKVDNQTEAGLKQYLKRALKEGVTADEIIDAMLVSFPTLGLTKILWAMDIIIAMDLEAFQPENMARTKRWVVLSSLDDIHTEIQEVEVEGRPVFVINRSGTIRVFSSICPHQFHCMTLNDLSGDILTCPGHGLRYNILTGERLDDSNEGLTLIESRIDGTVIYVHI